MKVQWKILTSIVCLLGLIECVPVKSANAPNTKVQSWETSQGNQPLSNTFPSSQQQPAPAPPLDDVHLNTTVFPAEFDKNYTFSINAADLLIFAFTYNKSFEAVRVSIESHDANSTFPLLVVVRQQEGILSWQLPLVLDHVYAFNRVERTLCPVVDEGYGELRQQQRVFVDISTMLPPEQPPIDFSLSAQLLPDFLIGEDDRKSVNITPSEPQFFLFQFPNASESVMLSVTSPDPACMTLSVQPSSCPVFDLDSNVAFDGKYLTLSTQGSLFLERKDYSSGKFFVVLIMKPANLACAAIETIQPAGLVRRKFVTIAVSPAISNYQYLVAVLVAAGLISFIVLVAILWVCLTKGGGYQRGLELLASSHQAQCWDCPPEAGMPPSPRSSFSSDDGGRQLLASASNSYGTMQPSTNTAPLGSVEESGGGATSGEGDNSSTSSLDTSDIDFLHDANEEKDIYRTKVYLMVSDLARKTGKKLDKIYKIYHWNLLTISIFYGLPVIQLVITQQLVLQQSGNQDLCYYNFDCAHPLGPISSFNNVYSNVGYVVLGILFIVIVYIRDTIHKAFCKRYHHLDTKYGLPQHFGLYYAMGLALTMEGVMSACYHMCPSYSNFQFDTSFMYIIACLCILKIYQNRHPDVNAKAHASYLFMSIIILIAVLGVVYGSSALWIVYGCIHMLTALVLSANIYYLGRWKIDRHIFKRIFFKIRTDGIRCAKPAYLDRFFLLFVGNAINWTFALYGAITQPSDFATYLLAVFIGNLLLYVLFYIIMKLRSGERLPNLALGCILLSVLVWGSALYFFFHRLTSWNVTPAMSRQQNQRCVLLNFYDLHDVWHFLSALSLFLSFMILLTLDDDLIRVERSKIPVF